ncbi:MAG TPA: hypothetical protein VK064_02630 [Wenzhouxiangella sp.]|nr:hypothetical protein [Wenzhouxiangella sp.]
MKILLAGLLERDAAAINILVRMAWRDHQVVSLPRSLSLTIPDQDNTARSCKCCIIDLAGLGLRRYSTENESRLQEFLSGRPAVLIVRGGGEGWLSAGLTDRIGPAIEFVTSPYTTATLRTALKTVMTAATRPAIKRESADSTTGSAVQQQYSTASRPAHPSGRPSRQPAWKRALTFAQRQENTSGATAGTRVSAPTALSEASKTGGELLFRVFPELSDLPELQLFKRITGSGSLPVLLDFKNGPVIVINRAQGWLATRDSLSDLIKAHKDPGLTDSLRLKTIPAESVESVVRERFDGEYYRVQRPLDEATWELVSEALSGVTLNPNAQAAFQLRRIPNFTRLKRINPIDLQLAAVCAHAPQTVDLLLNAFARHRDDVLRFVALCFASGLASLTELPVDGGVSFSPSPAARKASRGFFRSLMEKLLS